MVKFSETRSLFLIFLQRSLVETQFILIFAIDLLWKNYLKIQGSKAILLS
jgi:hypothetical protein